jgi:amino acid adenylation domain-containing protein
MTVYSLFKKQVEKNPKAIAVSFNGREITYSKLSVEAEKAGSLLISSGIKQGDIVGLCVNRSPEMVSALLGIIKSGAVYLPLDPFFPDKKLEFMLNDSDARFLITESVLLSKLNYFKGKFIDIEEINKIQTDAGLSDNSNSDSLAYVIYTSGSTGNPKGVQILHSSLTNFLLSMQKTPGLKADDNLLALTTLSFDISGLEIFLPLITGARITIASREEAKDGKELLSKIKKENVTVVQATPSTWKMLIDSGWKEKLNIKALCGAEALPRDLADKIIDRVDELWNMYGPTETTIWSSCAKVMKGESIHLGKPIANTQFYIVDKNLNFCPPGVAGELLIGGDGLSIGYLNREDLTAEKFITNPFDKEKKSRVYRTGDLVRLNPKMQLEFLGRIDNQVKIRGFRIELEEIETVIEQNEYVKDCAVVVKEINNDKKILAYVTINEKISKDSFSSEINKIRESTVRNLPEYMVPSLIIPIDRFPLTANNKTDKKALAELDTSGVVTISSSTKAETETHKVLVKIWEYLLGISGIGIDDNFFELGGHSILATQMIAEFEKSTGKKIPLAAMFTAQTVRELAATVENGKIKLNWKPLVEIKRGDSSLLPLFLIHGAEGNVFLYRDLAKRLTADRTVYGIQSRGLSGEENFNSIEEMAEHYVQIIRTVQPKGPYNIGGYCMGGTVAYEIGQQLSAANEHIQNIFLIETYNACLLDPVEVENNRIKEKIQNIKFHIDNFKSLRVKDKITFMQRKTQTALNRTSARISNITSSIFSQKNNEVPGYITLSLREVNDRANAEYRSDVYKGKVVLLRPKVSFSTEPDPEFGWGNFVEGELKVYTIDAAPRGMLTEPFVKETSKIIDKELKDLVIT